MKRFFCLSATILLLMSRCANGPLVIMELSRPNGLGSEIPFVKAEVYTNTIYAAGKEQTVFNFSPKDAQMRIFVKKGDEFDLAGAFVEISAEDPLKPACFDWSATLPRNPLGNRASELKNAPPPHELAFLFDVGSIAREQCPANQPIFAGRLKVAVTVWQTDGSRQQQFPILLKAMANCPDIPASPEDPDRDPCTP